MKMKQKLGKSKAKPKSRRVKTTLRHWVNQDRAPDELKCEIEAVVPHNVVVEPAFYSREMSPMEIFK